MFKKMLYLIICLSLSRSAICMEEGARMKNSGREKVYLKEGSIKLRNNSEQNKKRKHNPDEELNELTHKINDLSLNTNFDPVKFKKSLKRAPDEAIDIINILKDENAKKLQKFYRYIMLEGRPGTGKSTLAKAIAWDLGRRYYFIAATELLGHHRNQTVEKLYELFNKLSKYEDHKNGKQEENAADGKPVLILDEVNVLTDSHASEHTDTDETTKALWTLLDAQENKDDFFMIATTNEAKKMPHQLQSRFINKIIEIKQLDADDCKEHLLDAFKEYNFVLAEDCNDVYLTELSRKLDGSDCRKLESLVAFAATKLHKLKSKQLTKAILEEAYLKTQGHIEKYCDFGTEHIPAEERRHRETLAQNKAQYDENKELQIKLAELSNGIQTHLATSDTSEEYRSRTWERAENIFYTIFPDRKWIKIPLSYRSCNIM